MEKNCYRLLSMPHAHCFVAIDEDSAILVSYMTPVMRLELDHENKKLLMFGTGYYSRTTAKQIGKFLRETGILNYGHYKTASKLNDIIEGDPIVFNDSKFYDAVKCMMNRYRNDGTQVNALSYKHEIARSRTLYIKW